MFQFKGVEEEEEEEEQHIIYAVSVEEYESCRVRSQKPRIIAYCTSPARHRSGLSLSLNWKLKSSELMGKFLGTFGRSSHVKTPQKI